MKEAYETPELEIILIDEEDIIFSSGGTCSDVCTDGECSLE